MSRFRALSKPDGHHTLSTRAGRRRPDQEDGWRAMALTNVVVAAVLLIGGIATRAGAVTLLRQLLDRRWFR